MDIVTGHTGKAHVSAVDAAMLNMAVFGAGEKVLDIADKFAYEIVSNNQINIKSGELLMYGRHGRIPKNTTDKCVIENGTQNQRRHDFITCRFERDVSGIEKMFIHVLKGTPHATAPKDPIFDIGNVNDSGAVTRDMVLYRVVLNGLNIERVDQRFSVCPKLPIIYVGTELPLHSNDGDIFLLIK